MSLWQWNELRSACGLRDESAGPAVEGISIDTRTLQPGDLFVALSGDPGPRFHTSANAASARDGHEFISRAEQHGAAALMISRPVESSLPCLQVDDTLDGLWALGAYGRRRISGRVAAITGSSGKTTARHWLQAVLDEQGRVHGSPGSFNNHWGVPLSLARMPADTEFGVFEVGMNHPGEISPLSSLVAPDVALVLNVLPAHLGQFDSLDGIRREKLSIADGLGPDGTLVVPATLDCSDVAVARRLTFGFEPDAAVRGSAEYIGDRSCVQVTVDGRTRTYELPGGGEHRVLTSLAVVATVYVLGGDVDRACEALERISTPPGRGNVITAGEVRIIDDSYNANPVSMGYAIDALAAQDGRRIALLGEMRELGPDGPAMHEALMPRCERLDGIITVGEGFAGASTALGERHWGHYASAGDIDLPALTRALKPGDRVLVKGANKVFWVQDFVNRLAAALSGN